MEAMMFSRISAVERVNYSNSGPRRRTTVAEIAEAVTATAKSKVIIQLPAGGDPRLLGSVAAFQYSSQMDDLVALLLLQSAQGSHGGDIAEGDGGSGTS